ncbi:MAG: flavodoxin domain-containing protein [Anaerolineales bacterium]|jgi:flavodoxin
MNALVVCFSKFGNTKQVAQAIGAVLSAAGPARVIGTDQLGETDFEGVDLVVMGSPTHRMNLPEAVRPVLKALPRRVLRGAAIAAFDTSYKMSPWLAPFTAAPRLDRKLRRLGGRRVVPAKTFHVTGREGPLYDGELERARAWAQSILRQLG